VKLKIGRFPRVPQGARFADYVAAWGKPSTSTTFSWCVSHDWIRFPMYLANVDELPDGRADFHWADFREKK